MVRFQILTLFPELFAPFSQNGLISRAIEDEAVTIDPIQLRNFAVNTHGQVDDNPYGGGSGMVLRVDAGAAALESAKTTSPQAKVILFTPRGKKFTQELAHSLAADSASGFILLCPRYEGVDQRIADHFVDLELNMGDYILMGGEVPAMAFCEAITRLLPGVLGNPESIVHESFEGHLLEHSHWTKPSTFREWPVPEILLSGNHKEIDNYRASERWRETASRRPDLITDPIQTKAEFSVGLIHHPVLDKQGDIITSSITNIDLHDIARSCRTFGVNRFYVAHPIKALRELSRNICQHWATGFGATYNPNRSEALATIQLVTELDEAVLDIESRTGKFPRIVVTSARAAEGVATFAQLRAELLQSETPHLLLLGTGWGLADEIMERAERRLEPVLGATDYNHLSVRAAAAIMLDKLLGARS